jgi:esterase/lipase superfamily enzyme
MSKLLWGKDIGNHLAIWWGGTHDWPVWREMIQHYLPW